MQFPAWGRPSDQVQAVESVSDIDPYWSERAHQSRAEPRATEKPCGVELARMPPDVTTFEECIEVERLIYPQSELGGPSKERVAE